MSKVLILGGARAGTGQATVRAFSEAGNDVIATVDPEVEAETAVDRATMPDVKWVSLDHSNTRDVEAYLTACDAVSSVVVIENFFYMERSDEFSVELWNKSLAVNLTLLRAVAHHARSWAACSSVTVLTSTEALMGSFGAPAYAATKAAVHNLVKSLANASGGSVRFNAVAAGWIGGVMDTDDVFNMSREITPLGRLGTPEEVASVIRYIAVDASFVNGSVVVVDGGYSGVDTISRYEYKSEFGDS